MRIPKKDRVTFDFKSLNYENLTRPYKKTTVIVQFANIRLQDNKYSLSQKQIIYCS